MPISKCINCGQRFERSQVLKAMFGSFTYKPVICKECKAVHYPTISSRLLFGFIQAFPILFMNKLVTLFGVYSILLYIAWIIAVILMSPHIYRYRLNQ